MCYAFMNGAKEIIPISDVEKAREYLGKGMVVAAEREGVPVEGFTMGNSPESFTREIVGGKTIVLTTTNGTQAIHQSVGADKIITGAFTNISAVCNWLIGWQQPVALVCAGWKNKFNLEDTVFAGAVLHTIKRQFDMGSDSCVAAINLFLTAQQDMAAYLRHCNHAQRFEKLGIDDLEICLKTDETDIVPIFTNGVLKPLEV